MMVPRPQNARAAQAILVGGALAGVLDIAAAFIVYGLRGATPPRILQSAVILAVHMVCVGLPIALATARYAPAPSADP